MLYNIARVTFYLLKYFVLVYITASKRKMAGSVLLVDGYRYNKGFVHGIKTHWRCVKRNYGCRATVTTLENHIIKFMHQHNHT